MLPIPKPLKTSGRFGKAVPIKKPHNNVATKGPHGVKRPKAASVGRFRGATFETVVEQKRAQGKYKRPKRGS